MSETAAEDSTGGAGGVEGGRVHLDLALLAGRGNHEAARSGIEVGRRRRGSIGVEHVVER